MTSWLNQLEIWFGILSRNVLPAASFKNVIELRQAIDAFLTVYKPTTKLFNWREGELVDAQLIKAIVYFYS